MKIKSKILITTCIAATLITTATFADVYKIDSRGETVKEIQIQLKEEGIFFAAPTGHYGELTQKAVIEFQTINNLSADGMVGPITYKALFNEEQKPSEGKIEAIKWEEADKIFYRGADAKVVDVLTGKAFNLRRTYGRNHADVEPLTAEDTRIMREIWGGESWARRAVIVEIDGRKLLASSNGMPHAGRDDKPANIIVDNRSCNYGRGTNLDAVKGNDMDGQFCIHFLGSKTHSSNKMDAKHQNTIREAYKKIY